jgi:hypothetical protein
VLWYSGDSGFSEKRLVRMGFSLQRQVMAACFNALRCDAFPWYAGSWRAVACRGLVDAKEGPCVRGVRCKRVTQILSKSVVSVVDVDCR